MPQAANPRSNIPYVPVPWEGEIIDWNNPDIPMADIYGADGKQYQHVTLLNLTTGRIYRYLGCDNKAVILTTHQGKLPLRIVPK